eukprot:Clim_evm57s142 gene=Clim_evmTU57s142
MPKKPIDMTHSDLKVQYVKSFHIEKEIEKDRKERKNRISLLLLGPGESGKSTFFKQIRHFHGAEYSKDERERMRLIAYRNVLENVVLIADTLTEKKGTEVPAALNEIAEHCKESLGPDLNPEMFATELAAEVERFIEHDLVKEAMEHGEGFNLQEAAIYFFQKLVDLKDPAWLPDHQDILHCREMTCGVVEARFHINQMHFEIIDVAGQKASRRKWIHYFDHVNAIIFFAAVNCYAQTMTEEPHENRMVDTLNLFEEVLKSKSLQGIPVILFLNKQDLLKRTLKRYPLKECFPGYTGGTDKDQASEFILGQFQKRTPNKETSIYHHMTTATDGKQMKMIWDDVVNIIIEANLADAGLI